MKLKVCGMCHVPNIQEVLEKVNPDYLGFIFHPASPRYVKPQLPPEQMPNGIKKVGVFVNRPLQEVLEDARRYCLDVVQLHGSELPEMCAALKASGLEVWKVFSVGESFDFAQTQCFSSKADMFLFDTQTACYGGSGKKFNWALLQQYTGLTPFWLSGGIDLQGLEQLAQLVNLPLVGLDVNSRFEDAPGLKNVNQLLRLREALSAIKLHNA